MTKKNFTTLEVGGDYENGAGFVRILEQKPNGNYRDGGGIVYSPDGACVNATLCGLDIIRRVTIKDYEPDPLDIREGCTVLLRHGSYEGPIRQGSPSQCHSNHYWYAGLSGWNLAGHASESHQSRYDIVHVFTDDTTAAQMAEKAEEQRLKYEQEQKQEGS